jgi:hypothetical protein
MPNMTDTVNVARATIIIGLLSVDGFMLPHGSYRMSQTQMAEAVGLEESNVRRFLVSKSIKVLLGKGYTPETLDVEKTDDSPDGRTRINSVPLDVVSVFWLQQSTQGNKKAIALVMALVTESLERRFDHAFKVKRSEEIRNIKLSARIDRLSQDLDLLIATEQFCLMPLATGSSILNLPAFAYFRGSFENLERRNKGLSVCSQVHPLIID